MGTPRTAPGRGPLACLISSGKHRFLRQSVGLAGDLVRLPVELVRNLKVKVRAHLHPLLGAGFEFFCVLFKCRFGCLCACLGAYGSHLEPVALKPVSRIFRVFCIFFLVESPQTLVFQG